MSRIVMLTDDVPIDRRILQEAATLQLDGHHVVLLAGHVDGMPRHEVIDDVRVERFVPPGQGHRERLVSRWLNFSGRAVNGLSRRSQRMVGLACGAAFGFVRRVYRRLHPRSAESRVLGRAQRFGTWALVGLTWRWWWLLSVTNTKVTLLGLRVLPRTRRVPLRDLALADRAAYYRPDVVHAHDLPQLRAGVLAAERVGAPMVYDAHELYPEIGTLTPRQQRRLGRLERKFIRRCDATITVNPYIADEMARRYHVTAPQVILNAIDPDAGPVAHGGLRAALGLGAEMRIILFQGWLSPTRGLDHLIRAMGHTSDHLHLVFMSYGDMVSELTALARSLDIGHRVHFHPAVPQAELLAWTASADVGVIPYPAVDLNHRFCSPNKLFEFIQARLPVVANDLPFLRDVVVGEGIGAVAAIEDPVAFGAAIEAVASATPERRAALLASLEAAAPRYSWQAQEPVLRSIYAGLGIHPSRPTSDAAR